MLQRLPRRIDRITDQLEGGRLTVRLSLFGERREQSFVTGLVQQAVVAGLAAAVSLCGVILIVADVGPRMTPGLRAYTFVGFTLLLFGFVLGARALALTFREQHLGGAAAHPAIHVGRDDGENGRETTRLGRARVVCRQL